MLKQILTLSKIRISLSNGFSALIGYTIARGEIDIWVIMPVLGVFFLAVGAGMLNQFQERDLDAKMERTKKRPLASGQMSPNTALALAFSSLLAGTVILYYGTLLANSGFKFQAMLAAVLGLTTVIFYNAVYTPLKKKTSLAVFVGSFVGSIPPVIGFVSAGGYLWAPEILSLAAFYYIWQIPHFWLLLLCYKDDYLSAKVFKFVSDIFSQAQLLRIIFYWTVLTAITPLFLSHYLQVSTVTSGIFALSGVALIVYSVPMIIRSNTFNNFKKIFITINLFVLLTSLALSFDKLL